MTQTPSPAFPSLAALRAAHNTLLQAHREHGEGPALYAEIQQFLQQGQASGALLDAESERWTAQSTLDYWTATLLSAGQTPPDALLDDFDPALAPELPDDLCPYVGLDAFREDKSTVFFGRQRLARAMVDQLKAARLLAVVGPSGSGKSSLVLAGLLPLLKQGAIPATESAPSSAEWRYAPRMVPGSDPLANLARLLQSAGADDETTEKPRQWRLEQVAQLKQEDTHLLTMVNTTGDAPAVLVVDQFEELFTLCTDEPTRQAFANNLLRLTQTPGLRHTVILTMRTDFESFITRLPGFQPFFEQAILRVTPLNAAELREAIEKPAEQVGLKFEAGIVESLLQDILGEPAALPLLQFTLLKLWEGRERNRITWEAYRRLGGGRLALARSADELYDSLIPEEQVTARRILMRLVRPGEGLEVTSNRVLRAALYRAGEARDRIDRVVAKLIDARLLRVSEGDSAADMQIEVAHEALVRNWPRLVEWLDEERVEIRERQRLTAAAIQWEKVNRDPGALWRGALLEEALRYKDLNELENEFLRASRNALLAVEREQEQARQRELAQARALAEEQRQRADAERGWAQFQEQTASRLRQRAYLLSLISVLAVLCAAAAVYSGIMANQNANEAIAQRAMAEVAGQQAIESRKTAIAERDQGLSAQATLAANLAVVLTVQADTQATLAAMAVIATTPTPTRAYPAGRPTPTPESSDQISSVYLPNEAVLAAVDQVSQVYAVQTEVAALPTPEAAIAQIEQGSTAPTVQTNLVFEVTAFDPSVGRNNGDGIDFVVMDIVEGGGNTIYSHNERDARYCAFAGGEPACNAWIFADNNYTWPDGRPIQGGVYTLRAVVYALSGTTTTVEQTIEIVPPSGGP